jgi:hypothetical protein
MCLSFSLKEISPEMISPGMIMESRVSKSE